MLSKKTPTLDATRKSRKGGQVQASFVFAFALRLQRVDGRRLDAFVADLHCSRVHRGAALIVSYVSALPVRVQSVRVCMVCFVASCTWGCACGRARVCACVCMCLVIQSNERGEVEPSGALRATSASTM